MEFWPHCCWQCSNHVEKPEGLIRYGWDCLALMTEAQLSFETSVNIYQLIWQNNTIILDILYIQFKRHTDSINWNGTHYMPILSTIKLFSLFCNQATDRPYITQRLWKLSFNALIQVRMQYRLFSGDRGL